MAWRKTQPSELKLKHRKAMSSSSVRQ